MPDRDRWNEDRRFEPDRFEDERPTRRPQEPPGRSFERAPRIGPTGMVSGDWTDQLGPGRYYDDYDRRAEYGGYQGGSADYGLETDRTAGPARPYAGTGRQAPRNPAQPRRDLIDEERQIGGPYTDYGRAAGDYGPGGGYATPQGDAPRESRSFVEGPHRGRGPKGYKRSDERIFEDVNDRLTDDPMVDASDVEVRVENGEVTLNGTVASRFAKRRAEDCADSVAGVGHVQNNLRIDAGRATTIGSQTDPRIAAVSEGRDADDEAQDEARKPSSRRR
jgi:hypothetical protein